MKIDNILNKEKSPDKAEKASDVENSRKPPTPYEITDNKLPGVSESFSDKDLLSEFVPTTQKLKSLLVDHTSIVDESVNISKSSSTKSPIQSGQGANRIKNGLVAKRNNGNLSGKSSGKSVNKQKLFLCSECNQHFQKWHLFSHIKNVHNKFTCLYCYGFFIDSKSLENHLTKKHKVQNNSFFDEKSLKHYFIPDMDSAAGKSIKVICCKCGSIFDINDHFDAHQCVGVEEDNMTNVTKPAVAQIASDSFSISYNETKPAVTEVHNAKIEIIRTSLPPPPPSSSSSLSQLQRSSQSNENEHLTTKLVPKITLKIPRAYQCNNIESEDDSDDEFSSSEESDDKERDSFNRSNDYSSSLSEKEEIEKKEQLPMPSLKLKIKNLASNNPESVLENLPELMESSQHQLNEDAADNDEMDEEFEEEKDADITEQPMEIEAPLPPSIIETKDEVEKIVIDGVTLTPAGDDVIKIKIKLDEGIDNISITKLMKICLRSSFPYCLYCNHARKIVVHGKALAFHFITNHQFHATLDSITTTTKTNEEGQEETTSVTETETFLPERIVKKLKQSISELETSYFNLDTFDNTNEEMKEGHVTISHDKLYECFQCRFQTPIHKELYLHNRKMHQKSLISCLMCKTPFYSYSELLCHICPGVSHKQTYIDYKFYCCLCNLDDIPSAFRLMIHLRKKHFACDVCLEKCSDQGKLSSHVWKHKLFHLCYRCNICYRNKADIMKHLFWKHGTEGVECRKCLQKKWPHVYHFCTPPSEFKCHQCELSFSRAIALKVHMRLHEDDGAKYECAEIGCEKKFISKKLLIRHLERHRQEKMASENDQEITPKSTIIIPDEIPDGCCTRTIPIVFNRLAKKVPKLKTKSMDVQVKEEEQPQPAPEDVKKEEKEAKKVMELPESKLNLSESSDSNSDSDSDDDDGKKSSLKSLAARLEAELDENDEKNDDNEETESKTIKKSSSLTDSEDEICETDEDPATKLKKEEETKSSVDEVKNDVINEETTTKKEEENIENRKVHVCQSDHDYAQLFFDGPLSNIDEYKEKKLTSSTAKDKKDKQKAPKKPSDPFGDFSSSSNSSDSSDSSSNSSSSSSSSSGTSSDTMSSSEASVPNDANNKKSRNKKYTKKRQKKPKADAEPPPEPKDPDDIIYESDLATNESDTDEDFYDEHPLKLDSKLAEKRKELSKGDMFDGILENSRPSTPSLPPEEKVEKKLKKKKKKEARKSFLENCERKKYEKYSNVPQIKTQEANEIRHLLQTSQQQPMLSILKPTNDYINVSQVPSIASSATSSRMNSDSENPPNVKRSQRKRVPNKFYGYTSGDESMALQVNPNDPFRPIPPPQFTWRKEDLPEKSKSPSNLKVAPLKLNLANDQLQQQLHSFAVEHKQPKSASTPQQQHFVYNEISGPIPMRNLSAKIQASSHVNEANNTASSDEDALHISEPRKVKRKGQNQASSMYAFHTLETPPTVSNPPLKFKLSLGGSGSLNNNTTTGSGKATRKRNSTPKNTPAKRKRVEKESGPKTFMPGSSTSFHQTHSKIHNGKAPHMSHQEKMDREQKLEVAIQNTQQYFQRFNYAQVASNEISTKVDDGRVYCYCRRAYDDLQGMIGCDGSNCQIEWFHFECVGILVAPKGSWFCPECQKEQSTNF